MGASFDCFVVFAEMRTGSNFLEESLNEYPGLRCLGELFNPHFIGHAGKTEGHGVTLKEREADPQRLLSAIMAEEGGLPGFRFFNDHDPRILARLLPDPRCAKVILTRNPVDSYVSHRIAQATGQWRLGDMKKAKSATATFDAAEFVDHLERLQAFQMTILRGLQTTGQTGFYIAYEDLQDIAVLNGLALFLGVEHEKKRPSKKTKVQNPKPLRDKVTNFAEMETALAGLDRFNLNRTPNFEPRRGRAVPSYVAAARSPVLFQPIPCGPTSRVQEWLAALDGVGTEALRRGFFQKSLRQWKRERPGHRSFTVLRHPVARLHEAMCRHILPADGEAVFHEIRRSLRDNYSVPLPEGGPDAGFGAREQRAAFLGFARFVGGNLSGQTGIRVDEAWASQFEIVRGMAEVQLPDIILRESQLEEGLAQLAAQIGRPSPAVPRVDDAYPVPLDSYYDEEVEAAARAACQRDYVMFGFRSWDQDASTVTT